MKETTHKFSWLKVCNGLLSGTLALLGYTSCDSLGDEPVEYGSPYAKYEIKGKVTDRDTKTAIEGARIIVNLCNGSRTRHSLRRLLTPCRPTRTAITSTRMR